MHTRCLTAVDLAEHVAIQIQFWPLAVKATSDTDLMWISFPSVVKKAVLSSSSLQNMEDTSVIPTVIN